MAITHTSKKVLKGTLIALVVLGLVGAYIAPLFSGAPRLAPEPAQEFVGPPAGQDPFVNGPTAAPTAQDALR